MALFITHKREGNTIRISVNGREVVSHTFPSPVSICVVHLVNSVGKKHYFELSFMYQGSKVNRIVKIPCYEAVKGLTEMNVLKFSDFTIYQPSKYVQGYTNEELEEIVSEMSNVNMDRLIDALNGNTCMLIDGKTINYHWDVEAALRAGIEHRALRGHEWD